MASVYQVLSAMEQQVVLATTGLSMFDSPIAVETGLYWPPIKTLSRITKMAPPGALVSVYDRKVGHDTTRWIPALLAQTSTTPLLVSVPASQFLLPGGSGTLTLSGGVAVGDEVSLLVKSRGAAVVPDPGDGSYTQSPTVAVVYSTKPGDSPTTAATSLAAMASASPTVGPWVRTTVSSPGVLTIQNLLPSAVTVTSYTGNGGVNTTEIGRRKRELQITVWAPTPEIRDIVANPIEVLVAQMEVFGGTSGVFQSGLVLADGSFARIEHYNDFLVDDPMLADLYRRDMILSADYPVTQQDLLYSVLAPILQYQFTA
jgi:hypothetical protein